MGSHVYMPQTAGAMLDDDEQVEQPNVAVTATKKSHARTPSAWFFRKVDQR